MNFLRAHLMQSMLALAGVVVLGAGIATAKYEHNKAAEEAALAMTVPAETSIHVRLDQALDSGVNHPGDGFEAHVSSPVLVGDQVVIPQDTPVRGRVVDAIPSGRLMKPGRLDIALSEIELNGDWYPIETHETGRKGGSHRNRDIAWIAGGGGGGALIGALAAGGKGALIGGPIGAGAGTAVAFMTGKKNVHLSSETQLVFHTSQPLAVSPRS